MKQIIITTLTVLFFTFSSVAQDIGIKTNTAYWATTTPNLGLEIGLGKRSTFELAGGFNPFKFADSKRVKHWLIQPEFRYWTCERFNGHFFGLHGHGSQFNVGGWDIPVGRLDAFKDRRYQGYLYGGGLSYGYQWVMSPRWNFELSLGAGYARIHYEEYPCQNCGTMLDEGDYDYFGVTKAAVSLIYFIK